MNTITKNTTSKNTITKSLTAAGVAGIVAMAALTSPAEARSGRAGAAVGGFIAGAAVGAAVAGSSRGYYGGPGYYYAPGPYAYEAPAYGGGVYVAPAPRRCWVVTDSTRGYGYYGHC